MTIVIAVMEVFTVLRIARAFFSSADIPEYTVARKLQHSIPASTRLNV